MKHQKLLREKYLTFAGAGKRAAFERTVNPSEFARGYAARLYRFRVVSADGLYRVERFVSEG